MNKKIISLLLAAVMLFSLGSVCAFASDVIPAVEYTANAKSSLSINSTTATCKSIFTRNSDAKSIVVTQTLEKSTLWWWSEINTWEKTFNQNNATYTNKQSSLSSGTYRVKSVFTVTGTDGGTETITVYSSEKTVD